MQKGNNRIKKLIIGYANNQLSSLEISELMDAIHTCSDGELFEIFDLYNTSPKAGINRGFDKDRLTSTWNRIRQRMDKAEEAPYFNPRPKSSAGYFSLRLAAAVLIFLSLIGIIFLTQYEGKNPTIRTEHEFIHHSFNTDIENLELILPDGTQIGLDKEKGALIANEFAIRYSGGDSLSKLHSYTPEDQIIVRNPKGKIYEIHLADGSKIWLKPDTEIQFPAKFTSDNRNVYLRGEAFFDIRPLNNHKGNRNERSTFTVTTDFHIVSVVGTKFNVAAYSSDKLSTTLLSGKVHVIQPHLNGSSTDTLDLKPGQQAIYVDNKPIVSDVDAAYVADWINGNLAFDSASIFEIMTELAKWYNIKEIEFQGNMPAHRFSGKISTQLDLNAVFEALTAYQVSFQIVDQKVIVRNHQPRR